MFILYSPGNKSGKLEGIQYKQGKMRMFYRRDKSCVREVVLCLEKRWNSLSASLWNAPLTIGSIQGTAFRSCMKDVGLHGSDSPNLWLPPPALLNLVKLPCVTALMPKEMEWSFWFKHFQRINGRVYRLNAWMLEIEPGIFQVVWHVFTENSWTNVKIPFKRLCLL